jgi:hypothetical protein
MVFMPLDGNHFGFRRINDKVKDKLVLSVEEAFRVVKDFIFLLWPYYKGGHERVA